MKLRRFHLIGLCVVGAFSVRAQDIKNYSWSGAATPSTPPPIYRDTSDVGIPTYEMVDGRLHAASPGVIGDWVGMQFDWPFESALANSESISGSLKLRLNSLENNGNAAGNRIRLFQFNAPWANGLTALFTLMGADSKVDFGPDQWRPGGHGEWNKWEMNPNVVVEPAPEGKTYLYNSFNMNNPATDPDYFRLVDNGTDFVLTWTAQYEASCDRVKVTTALDGVPWTVTYIGMHWPDWLLSGGWTENAMAKAWPNMGAWDTEFSEIRWTTTTAPSAPDIKNYWWHGTAGCVPPVYRDSSGVGIPTFETSWSSGVLHAASPGVIGDWVGMQFDWPFESALANSESISGSLKFRLNSLENNGNAAGNRIRLFQFNAPWANGLTALFTLMGADSKVDLGPDQWRPGGHPEWNKWEMNPNVVVEPAPEGKTYLYNSFNMNNPATDPDYFRLIDSGTDHTLTWTAHYLECDVVQVATALDGVPWTVTDIGRQYPDWLLFGGWTENVMAKAWPNMGAWDTEFSEIRWATALAAVGECAPTLDVTRLPNGDIELSWSAGTLWEAVELTDEWQAVVGATSPYTVTPSGQRKFYRSGTP